jgi:DNA-binding response OmpR family regulator
MGTESDVLKVVLVEDDVDYAEIYRQWLERVGYEVFIATDGESGLELIGRELPDLVYLDLRMPGLDGFGLLSALRADSRTAHVPVVMLSNYDEPELRQRGVELGVLEWIVKADVTPTALAERTAALMKAEADLANDDRPLPEGDQAPP